MNNMLNKFKKFMVIAAAAVMLSAGFATVAPHEAHAAHWADKQMNWALNNGYITVDLRDSLASRQDAWLIMGRAWRDWPGMNRTGASNYVSQYRVAEDGRPTDLVTRQEMAAFIYNFNNLAYTNKPWPGFLAVNVWAVSRGIYDGTRQNSYATRAEVVTMVYNAKKKGFLTAPGGM